MRKKLAIFFTLVSLGLPVFAHRLDEYLQAIIVSVRHDKVTASMRLIPGVAVANIIISAIDLNGDGVFSEAEQRTYAEKILSDVSLQADGHHLQPHLRAISFPAAPEMKSGLGEIHLEFAADLPPGGSHRTITFENHHQPGISVYLMNCLVPHDRGLRVVAQNRNQNQSYYRVDYVQSGVQSGSWLLLWWVRASNVVANLAAVPNMFRLGMRHIAEGTDHLLFLLALLLPAPLLAARSSWGAAADLRHSLIRIVRVVTAFTIGHSITLALGASGIVSLPERPVEVLIAISILISAAHALRPIFPGREPIIAGFFGLIHGLAFAATLQNLGAGAWQRLVSILGFNLGVETMQLIVVTAILPSVIVLSRTSAYGVFRMAGASFAGLASLGWVVERVFGVDYSVDLAVDRVAQRGLWIALALFVISLVAWFVSRAAGHERNITNEWARPA